MQQIQERARSGAGYVPVYEELPLDPVARPLETFASLLRHRKKRSGSFFFQLSRVEGDSHSPTESILAFEPFETLRVRQGDPFTALSERLKQYRAEGYPELPFFQGGVLGYFAYDSVRHLEPTLSAVEGNLKALGEGAPEAGQYDAELMFFSKHLVYDHVRRKLYLMSGFRPADGVEQGIERARREIDELKVALRDAGPGRGPGRDDTGAGKSTELPMEAMTSMLGRERFLRGVRRLKENIRAGDIFQAVLSDKLSVAFGGDPLELFEALTRLSPAPYRFYFDSGEGVYLGASPELLLKARAGVLETHPIAGTRPRGRTPAEERRMESQLMRSEKERAEHLMLVDLARNDVGRVSEPGSVRVEEYMQIHKYSGVMHLVSRVTGKLLKGAGSIEALASCFPAGTLSGAPKIRAMQLLSELEPEPRGFYGGAVVAASFTGDLDSCISIRCIEVRGGRAIVQAGAGIVADSQPAREYDEITHKSRIARTALGLAGAKP